MVLLVCLVSITCVWKSNDSSATLPTVVPSMGADHAGDVISLMTTARSR